MAATNKKLAPKKKTAAKKTTTTKKEPSKPTTIVRLELKEGKSNKFWEIETQGGLALVSRFGRIGARGQEKKTSFPSNWEAERARKSQIEAKLKKGYSYAKTAEELALERPPAKPSKRSAALEAAILEDLADPKAWLVYADWLQGEGDPRGELVVLQTSLETKKSPKLKARAEAILEEHGDALLGALRKHVQTLDGKNVPTFEWRRGFVHSMRISYNQYARSGPPVDVPQFFTEALKHPSLALVQEIVIGEYNGAVWDKKRGSNQVYEPLIDCIVKAKPKALRRLVIGEYEFPDDTEISWTYIGSLAKLWKACPRLEEIVVQGGSIDTGKIESPSLRTAKFITGGLPRKSVQAIATASWPNLASLEIWFGDPNYGAGGKLEDIQPILEGKGLAKLKHLALANFDQADALAAVIGRSKIVKQLETLDLSKGTMTDEGARSLLSAASAMKHLARLDLTDNCIESTKGIVALAKKVLVNGQKDPAEERYVSVGE